MKLVESKPACPCKGTGAIGDPAGPSLEICACPAPPPAGERERIRGLKLVLVRSTNRPAST